MLFVEKEIREWLLQVANIVAKEFSLEEVETIYLISVEVYFVDLVVTTKNHRHYMMVWLEGKVPIGAKVVVDDEFVKKKISPSYEEEIGI